jgi:hypothetical protein
LGQTLERPFLEIAENDLLQEWLDLESEKLGQIQLPAPDLKVDRDQFELVAVGQLRAILLAPRPLLSVLFPVLVDEPDSKLFKFVQIDLFPVICGIFEAS